MFPRLGVGDRIAPTSITAHEVARCFKAAYGRLLGTLADDERRHLEPIGQDIAAHSTPIGAAQDLVASGADLVAVMQAGGWKDTSMPALYTRRLNALRGGLAQRYRDPELFEPAGSANCTRYSDGTEVASLVRTDFYPG